MFDTVQYKAESSAQRCSRCTIPCDHRKGQQGAKQLWRDVRKLKEEIRAFTMRARGRAKEGGVVVVVVACVNEVERLVTITTHPPIRRMDPPEHSDPQRAQATRPPPVAPSEAQRSVVRRTVWPR